MKITILNECFFTENHLAKLRKLGEVKIYKDTAREEQAIQHIKDADIAIADQFIAPLTTKVIQSNSKLKLLALNTTSHSSTDLVAARKQGTSVANVPGFSRQAVAEMALGLMFAVNRKIVPGDKAVRQHPFETDPSNLDHRKYMGVNFFGKTIGIIGMGNIGSAVAASVQGLAMQVVYYNRSQKKVKNYVQISLDELLRVSDVIVITVPLNDASRNLIGQAQFQKMKPTAIIVSMVHSEVMDIEALHHALTSRKIMGAGLDSVSKIPANHPILKLENVVFSPNAGWFTAESLENLANIIVENVESFVKGKPKNIVN